MLLKDKYAHFFYVPAHRRFVWMPVALGMGIGIYFAQDHEPNTHTIYFLSCVTLILFLLNTFSISSVIRSFKERDYTWHEDFWGNRFFALTFLLMINVGYITAFYHTHTLNTPLLNTFYKDLKITGTVTAIEERHSYKDHTSGEGLTFDHAPHVRLTLKPTSIFIKEKDPPSLPLCHKIRLKCTKSLLPQDQDIHPGHSITLKGSLAPFHGPIYPGGLDMRHHAYFEGLSAQGRVQKILEHRPSLDQSLVTRIQQLRHQMTHKIVNALGPHTGSIAAALITGDRSFIKPEVRQYFVDAGIAHILAISGLHLSIIAGFIFFIIRGSLALSPYMAEHLPIKKISAVCAILLTFGYLMLSGAGYPVQRAFCMITLGMIAILFNRQVISMRLLALAAFVILVLFPESLVSASFQLSFAAVTALIAFYETGWKALDQWSRHGHWLQRGIAYAVGVLFSTLVATLATTPFTIAFFNRFTMQAIVGNMLAIPLTSFFIMPLALFNVLSLSFGEITWLWQIFDKSLLLLYKIAFFTANLPGSAFLVPSPPTWAFLTMVGGGLFLCLWHNRMRLLGILPIIIGMIGFWYTPIPHLLMTKDMIAYPHDHVLWVSNPQKWFEKTLWQKHLGLSKTAPWTQPFLRQKSMLFISNPKSIPYKDIIAQCNDSSIMTYITQGYLPKTCQKIILARGGTYYDRSMIKDKVWVQWHPDDMITPFFQKNSRPWNMNTASTLIPSSS